MAQIHEVHPPLYFWLVNIWWELWNPVSSLISDQLVWLRLSSVIFGVLTVWFTWLLGVKLFKRRTALLASLFIALSSFHIYYCQELRMYPLILFLMLASFYCFLKLLEKPEIKPAAGYVLSSGLALLTHYYAFYMFAVEFVFLVFFTLVLFKRIKANCPAAKKQEKTLPEPVDTVVTGYHKSQEKTGGENRDCNSNNSSEETEILCIDKTMFNLIQDPTLIKQRWIWIVSCVILSCLFFLPWLPQFLNQTGAQDFTMRMSPRISHFFEIFSQIAYGFTLPHPHMSRINLYIAASLIPLFLLAVSIYKSKGMGKWFCAVSLILPVILTFIVTLVSRFHIFEFKYFFIIVPAFWLLLSEGILQLCSKWLRWVLIGVFLCINILSGYNAQFVRYYHPQDWREASAVVKSNMRQGDLVAVHPSMMSVSMFYYFRNNSNFLPVDFPADERMQLLKNYRGLWLVSTPNHPFVRQAGMLDYLRGRYPRKQMIILEKFLPSDTLLIEYFDLAPEHQGE